MERWLGPQTTDGQHVGPREAVGVGETQSLASEAVWCGAAPPPPTPHPHPPQQPDAIVRASQSDTQRDARPVRKITPH